MKNSTALFLSLMIVFLISGCQSTQQKDLEYIKQIENEIFSENGMLDRNRVDELIEAYEGYATQYPEDSLAADYLFKAGDIAMNTNRSNQAIGFYNRIIKEFPEYVKVPEAMFLQAYVYENNLGRLDKAKTLYEEFLRKYPENEFADDAEVSLRFLGKSPEELIEIFQQEKSDAAQE